VIVLLATLLLQADFTELYRQAYEERAAALGAKHAKTAESAVDLAQYLAGRAEYAAAAPFLPLVLAAPNPDANILHNWAVALEQSSPREAEQLYRRTLAIRAKSSPASVDLAMTRLNLAGLLVARGDTAAGPLARSALTTFEKSLGPQHSLTGLACGTLGAALAIQGDVPGAERMFRRSLAIAEKANGPNSKEAANALENLADLLEQTGRESAARPLRTRASAIRMGGK
jgi:tetratricopeptide (TPR) repeat protein